MPIIVCFSTLSLPEAATIVAFLPWNAVLLSIGSDTVGTLYGHSLWTLSIGTRCDSLGYQSNKSSDRQSNIFHSRMLFILWTILRNVLGAVVDSSQAGLAETLVE